MGSLKGRGAQELVAPNAALITSKGWNLAALFKWHMETVSWTRMGEDLETIEC